MKQYEARGVYTVHADKWRCQCKSPGQERPQSSISKIDVFFSMNNDPKSMNPQYSVLCLVVNCKLTHFELNYV